MKTLFILLAMATALFASPDPFLPEDGRVLQRTWIDVNPTSYYNDISSPTGAYADLTQYSYTAGQCLARGVGVTGLTVEIWIKMFADSVKTTNDFMLVYYTANLWDLKVSNDGTRIIGRFCDGSVSSDPIPLHTVFGTVKSSNMLDGIWHLVAMTLIKSADHTYYIVKFYVDGVLISTNNLIPPSVSWGSTNTLVIGGTQPVPNDPRNFNEPGFPGHFCGEVVSDTERTAAYILEHFTRFQNTISIGYRPPVSAGVSTILPLITVASFPEPFTNTVSLRFAVEKATDVVLKVFDVRGRVVATPFSGITTGTNTAFWDGILFPSGKYVYQLKAESVTKSGNITLAK